MRYTDFLKYKQELDAIIDGEAKSNRAIQILKDEGLSLNLDLAEVLLSYLNGFAKVDAWYYYIFNATIPYYKTSKEPV